MRYTKLGWQSNQSPDLNGENMEHMDEGIYNASSIATANAAAMININEDIVRNTGDIEKNTSDIATLSTGESAQGGWTPEDGTEYPTSPTIGDSWYVSAVPSEGYTFTTGDLTGLITYNMDKMIYTDSGWSLIEGNLAINVPTGIVNTITSPLFSMQLKNNISIDRGTGSALFSRDSEASIINRYGIVETIGNDEPRLGKDGILLEGESINLCLDNNNIQNSSSYWTSSGVTTIMDSAESPDELDTAQKQETSSNGYISTYGTSTQWTGEGTCSIFVKKDTSDTISLCINSVTDGLNFIDWTFSTETFTVGSEIIGEFKKLSNGWYRLEITTLIDRTDASNEFRIYPNTTTGVSTNSVYTWKAQVESGTIASSVIDTTSTPVTRSADFLIFSYKENFPGWDKPFSIVFDHKQETVGEGTNNFIFNNGTSANGYINQTASGAITFSVLNGGYCAVSLPQDIARIVCVSDGTTIAIYEDGVVKNTGIVGTSEWSGENDIWIGQNAFQTISNFKIYDKALTQDEISFMGAI